MHSCSLRWKKIRNIAISYFIFTMIIQRIQIQYLFWLEVKNENHKKIARKCSCVARNESNVSMHLLTLLMHVPQMAWGKPSLEEIYVEHQRQIRNQGVIITSVWFFLPRSATIYSLCPIIPHRRKNGIIRLSCKNSQRTNDMSNCWATLHILSFLVFHSSVVPQLFDRNHLRSNILALFRSYDHRVKYHDSLAH